MIDRLWSIRMGDVTYEGAVARLESWCLANGVERKGAEFLPGRKEAECGSPSVDPACVLPAGHQGACVSSRVAVWDYEADDWTPLSKDEADFVNSDPECDAQ